MARDNFMGEVPTKEDEARLAELLPQITIIRANEYVAQYEDFARDSTEQSARLLPFLEDAEAELGALEPGQKNIFAHHLHSHGYALYRKGDKQRGFVIYNDLGDSPEDTLKQLTGVEVPEFDLPMETDDGLMHRLRNLDFYFRSALLYHAMTIKKPLLPLDPDRAHHLFRRMHVHLKPIDNGVAGHVLYGGMVLASLNADPVAMAVLTGAMPQQQEVLHALHDLHTGLALPMFGITPYEKNNEDDLEQLALQIAKEHSPFQRADAVPLAINDIIDSPYFVAGGLANFTPDNGLLNHLADVMELEKDDVQFAMSLNAVRSYQGSRFDDHVKIAYASVLHKTVVDLMGEAGEKLFLEGTQARLHVLHHGFPPDIGPKH
jgi:hypothetical protein